MKKNLVCEFCGRVAKNENSYKQHLIRCKENPKRIDLSYMDKSEYKAKMKIVSESMRKIGKERKGVCKICNSEFIYIYNYTKRDHCRSKMCYKVSNSKIKRQPIDILNSIYKRHQDKKQVVRKETKKELVKLLIYSSKQKKRTKSLKEDFNKLIKFKKKEIKRVLLTSFLVCSCCKEVFSRKRAQVEKNCKFRFCCTKCMSLFNTGKKLKKHTKEQNQAFSEKRKQLFKEGKLKVYGGTTRWFTYKDLRVQGSYEYRTCYILDSLKEKGDILSWEYTNDRVSYVGEDGKKHTYLLDFKVFVGEEKFYYLETKGRLDGNDLLKWNSVRDKGFQLEVWHIEEIKKYEKDLKIDVKKVKEELILQGWKDYEKS